jgi:hypothetical protein
MKEILYFMLYIWKLVKGLQEVKDEITLMVHFDEGMHPFVRLILYFNFLQYEHYQELCLLGCYTVWLL